MIISDNSSKDKTPTICLEYAKKDNRIHFFQQEKNMGFTWNYNFVLQKAKNEYFTWVAADDIWENNFLEKNMKVLMSNEKLVGSIGEIKFYGVKNDNNKSSKIDLMFQNFIRKVRYTLKPNLLYSLSGSYNKKITKFLKKPKLQMLYGVYKTNALKKSMITEEFVGNDWPIIFNVLKYGDFHVIDDILIQSYNAGTAKKGMLSLTNQFKVGRMGHIFPYYPLTVWCLKNFNTKLFLRNIVFFIQLNIWGQFALSMDLIRLLIHKFIK